MSARYAALTPFKRNSKDLRGADGSVLLAVAFFVAVGSPGVG
jgi:hypothetical protein